MRIAVTGATGFLGRHLVDRLRDAGCDVVAITRGVRDAPAGWENDPHIDAVQASVTDHEAIRVACTDCDAIGHLAGINYERGDQTYRAVHIRGTRSVIDTAAATGVDRVLLTSYLRARPDGRSGYFNSKWIAEEIARSGSVTTTILKPAAIFGQGDQLLTHLAQLIVTARVVPRVGLQDRVIQPVAIEDVVDICNEALCHERFADQTVAVVGPERVETGTLIRRVGTAIGRRAVVLPAPVLGQYGVAAISERVFDPPLVTTAGVRMLAEGMTEPAPPDVCTPLPASDRPTQAPDVAYLEQAIEDVKRLGIGDLRGFE